MRILQLGLLAFGPFTDLVLELDSSHGFHVIYGPNEAGKTSARRALAALFYGIPTRTPDDFVHDYARMRLAGRLRHSSGAELAFQRRKGSRNTLLDPDGRPVADSSLAEFLGGVGLDRFLTMFAIDHDALARGGDEILRAGGGVGESIFAAGTGGSGLHGLIEGLKQEAAELFLPRGRNQVINRAVNDFNQAKEAVAEASLPGREWTECQERLDQALAGRAGLRERIRILDAERARLGRLRAALPEVVRRGSLLARLAEIGEAPVLDRDFATARLTALNSLASAGETARRAAQSLEGLEKEAGGIRLPEVLLVQEKAIIALHQRLGLHLKGTGDRIALREGRLRAERATHELLAELRPDLDVGQAEAMRLTAAQRARIPELSSQYLALTEGLERARKDVAAAERKLGGARAELDGLPPPRDSQPLRLALEEAGREGDLDLALQKTALVLAGSRKEADLRLRALGLYLGSLEEIEALPVPPAESVERFEREMARAAEELASLTERLSRAETVLSDLDRQIEEMQLTGAVPAEEDLAAARARREEGWRLIRREWLLGEDVSPEKAAYGAEDGLSAAYEKSVNAADQVADRLRREADRVAQRAGLVARRAEAGKISLELARETEGAEAKAACLQTEWRSLWAAAAIDPLPPREMRFWLLRREEITGCSRRTREREQEVQRLEAIIRRHREAVSGVFLTSLGWPDSAPGEVFLAPLLGRGKGVLDAVLDVERRRKELGKRIEDLSGEASEAAERLAQAGTRLEEWRGRWTMAVAVLGLGAGALPAEANAALKRLEDFFASLREMAGIDGRLAGIDQQAEAFAQEVEALVARLALDLAGQAVEQAAASLHARLTQAQKDSARLAGLEKQIGETKEALREAEADRTDAEQRLGALCAQAGCLHPSELAAVEARSFERQDIVLKLEELDDRLAALSGGASIDDLLAEVREISADELPARIGQLSQDIDAANAALSARGEAIGSLRTTLEGMNGNSQAAEAAEKAQAILAELRRHVRRYTLLKTASVIMRREIDRYRERNQGPLLLRAAEIFRLLTLGSFSGLQTSFNDKDDLVLAGVRPSGGLVRVEGMSDGTRDQLYLSLRLASLERYRERNEPLPFIVDDILIGLDDGRAEATLRVLAEFSAEKTQVIFFTHHARLVELAEKRLGEGVAAVQRLA
ncbi:MAG: AAA family ATPase [Pseudomonadota bacterium]